MCDSKGTYRYELPFVIIEAQDRLLPDGLFPQLSFSIVSLCNHLTRSLMKKVHLRTSEDLVSTCRALCLGTAPGL